MYNYVSTGSDGVTKVWVDGKLIADFKGKNSSPQQYAPEFKLGLYWSEQNRPNDFELFFDNVKIAEGKDGYSTVNPACK